MERSDGIPLYQKQDGNKVRRSQSFAVGTTSSQSSTSEASYNLLRPHHFHQTKESKSYKKTKVTTPPKTKPAYDPYFPASDIIGPPKEFAGLNASIQEQYNEAKRTLHESRAHQNNANHRQPATTKTNKAKRHKAGKVASADAVYEFEQKIPMQSSSLEAQKFKTVIFVSGH